MSPVVKFVDMRAAAGQRMSIVGARIGGENDSLPSESCTRILHPIHPVRRVAAAEAAKEMKAAATETRRQKEARARDNAARQRAVVRARLAYNMARHT
ncbi:hypothetical protein CY35_13G066700 [Sphagnum magellanicum]|nr:hypothetical protein CY35_13G066700 [Sphagnum magellanicum]